MPQTTQAAVMQLLAVVCLDAQGEACAVALLLLLAWLLV